MTVLILGGGGMIGQKLAARLIADGMPAADITLHDIAFAPSGVTGVQQVTGNVADPAQMQALAADKPQTIYHLASIVSGEAEADFDKGWDVNLGGMMHLLAALRADPTYTPRVVFTSSIAVFGGPYPDVIRDDFHTSPQSSYGAQKAMCEALLQDHSRKGFVDGISLRLPTICVRPGLPNKAASSFFSGIIREPLAGTRAVLPVDSALRHWFASPRTAIGFLIHAAALDTGLLGGQRALNLPGVSCTVADQIDALRDVAGQSAVDLIDHIPDPAIAAIVNGWPRVFAPERALALGFKADASFHDIIATYIADDMPKS